MARKLKTYQTSLGFFEQAIAAPSMKAALEAWGADSNLFHQGAAKESTDPEVIAATRAKPGMVLKRPVGSDGPFGEPPNSRRISARMDGRRPLTSHQRRSLLSSRTRRRTGRRLKRMNGKGGVASARRPKKRRLKRRSANAGSRLSPRRRPPWTKPCESMTSVQRPCTRSVMLSTKNRKPRTSVGRWRKRNWRGHCGGRETRAQRVRDGRQINRTHST